MNKNNYWTLHFSYNYIHKVIFYYHLIYFFGIFHTYVVSSFVLLLMNHLPTALQKEDAMTSSDQGNRPIHLALLLTRWKSQNNSSRNWMLHQQLERPRTMCEDFSKYENVGRDLSVSKVRRQHLSSPWSLVILLCV